MTIGFDASRAFIKKSTGTENYSYKLLKALAKLDKKNQYIIYAHSVTFYDAAVQQSVVQLPINIKFKTINWPKLWTQIGLAKQTFNDKLDVLFIPAHTSPLIHRRGLKTVVTVHDLGAEYLPRMHQLKQRLYLRWITHYQLKSATKLIAVSSATKEDLVKRVGIDSGKVQVIYEGYDEALFRPIKGLSRAKPRDNRLVNELKKFDLEPGNYFLFVGTVQPRKNLERLIVSYGRLLGIAAPVRRESLLAVTPRNHQSTAPDFAAPSLVIVGSKGWLSDAIYKLPKKLGIKDRVKFLGRVDDKDLPALYSGAIALTFPSLFEGFGLPILEAQACGCPVLTSNISSMPEVGGKGAIYVNPYSLEDIISGMRRLQVTGYRLQLIKAGFENVKRFSWEKCARETLKVLEEVYNL